MSELNLNLDHILPPPKPPRNTLLKFVFLLQILLLAAVAFLLWENRQRPLSPAAASGLSGEQLLSLARQLEDLDLPGPAVSLWKQYIAAVNPAPEKHARLLYRLGDICQRGRLYEDAISYYAQSEAVCQIDTLSGEIGRRTQECLEHLGLFSARNRDLQKRTDLSGSSSSSDSPVLAEIGSWKITRKDLERHIEQTFDQTASASGLPPEEILKQKKAYMKMFNEGDNFLFSLQQFIFDQLLSREIREQKLRENEQVLQKCRAVEKQLLDSVVLEKAIGHPRSTEAEARQYYDSHKDEFKKDEKLQPFAEVQNSIMNQLTSQKRKEAHQKYFQQLVDKYDVVFHTSLLPKTEEEKKEQAQPRQRSQNAPAVQPVNNQESIEL